MALSSVVWCVVSCCTVLSVVQCVVLSKGVFIVMYCVFASYRTVLHVAHVCSTTYSVCVVCV